MEQGTEAKRAGRSPGWEVTGNHFLAFPSISPLDGGIHRVNVLHRGALGLLEWAAERTADAVGEEPVLGPRLRVDGADAPIRGSDWMRLDHWIPRFRARPHPDIALEATLCAPGGGQLSFPGAVYLIELENRGAVEHTVEVGLGGSWRWALRTVVTSRPLAGANRVASIDAGAGVALELGGEPGLAALAVLAGGTGSGRVAAGIGEARPLGAGEEVDAPNGEPIRVEVARTVRLAPGERVTVPFFLAAAVERDGAAEHARAMRELGAAELIRMARLQLAQTSRRTRDGTLGALVNRNLHFATFFGLARAIDDDRLYPIASRSSTAGTAAVFRERDTLLWLLPALLPTDAALAREVVLRAFEQYSHRPGAWMHYIDGGTLSPRFALGSFCAYVVALDRYVQVSGDASLLDEPIVGEVIRELDDLLLDRLHPRHLLAATEALPSGEAAVHPYVTYDNVLFWAFCRALDRLWPGGDGEESANFLGAADEVAAALWRHAVAEFDGLRILAWSTDLEGEAAIYDDPEGSLAALPYLGFCDAEDPIWRNTIELLHSEDYPFWLQDRPFPGMASRAHPDRPSFPALCFDLLGPRRDEALDVLRRLKLEGGIACETYDPETGETATGAHHAGAAALLAWTLLHALDG